MMSPIDLTKHLSRPVYKNIRYYKQMYTTSYTAEKYMF